jgi:hypothetical protein
VESTRRALGSRSRIEARTVREKAGRRSLVDLKASGEHCHFSGWPLAGLISDPAKSTHSHSPTHSHLSFYLEIFRCNRLFRLFPEANRSEMPIKFLLIHLLVLLLTGSRLARVANRFQHALAPCSPSDDALETALADDHLTGSQF